MPDTAIFDTLRGILGEEDNLDARDFRDWLNRIETKIDGHIAVQAQQGERLAKLEEKATAAHRRLDEAIPSLKGPGRPAWLAISLAIITALSAVAVASISANKSDKQEKRMDEIKKEPTK